MILQKRKKINPIIDIVDVDDENEDARLSKEKEEDVERRIC